MGYRDRFGYECFLENLLEGLDLVSFPGLIYPIDHLIIERINEFEEIANRVHLYPDLLRGVEIDGMGNEYLSDLSVGILSDFEKKERVFRNSGKDFRIKSKDFLDGVKYFYVERISE